jgi:predicted phage tail protein
VKYVWEKKGGTIDAVLNAAVDDANRLNSPRLVIPGSKVANIATGQHDFNLTATNYLGVSTLQSVTFTKLAGPTKPAVTVVGGLTQEFFTAQGISITTQLVASSVCPGKQVKRREPPVLVLTLQLC